MDFSKTQDMLKTLGVAFLVSIFALSIMTFFFCDNDFPNGDKTVYTTKTGECYHLKHCDTLGKNKNEMTLREAVKQGYSSCYYCDSPELRGENGFSYDFSFYISAVPFAAVWSWAATNEIRRGSNVHYIIHLLVSLSLTGLIDFLF